MGGTTARCTNSRCPHLAQPLNRIEGFDGTRDNTIGPDVGRLQAHLRLSFPLLSFATLPSPCIAVGSRAAGAREFSNHAGLWQ